MSHATGWLIGAVVVAGAIGAPAWWLTRSSDPAPESPPLPEMPDPQQPPKKTGFADDTVPAVADIKFDAERSLKYLKQLCDIGPRVSGTEGMKRQQELLEKHFKQFGATVTRQEFEAKQVSRKDKTRMTNLVVTWHPDRDKRVLICSHYDTRPVADEEADRRNWNRPFVSANDGASGAAWMMEMAHHMKDLKTSYGVDFALFDGEEYVFDTHQTNPSGRGEDRYFLGSEHFADEYTKSRATRKHQYHAGVLMDLCHAKGARLRVEMNSWTAARPLVEQIWGVAEAVGAKSFKLERGFERDGGQGVQDDHLALIRAGIPSVDVIDFDYPHWHKLSDTPDKVSGEQMAEVAKVLMTWVQRIK